MIIRKGTTASFVRKMLVDDGRYNMYNALIACMSLSFCNDKTPQSTGLLRAACPTSSSPSSN